MSLRRWFIVLSSGSLAGMLWATVFVGSAPEWFNRLGTTPAVLLMLLPVAFSFACGAILEWWRLSTSVIYGIVVLAWYIPGSLHNELVHSERLSRLYITMELADFVAKLGLVLICWRFGRLLRQCLKGEFRPGAGSPPTDPELKTEN